MVSIPTNTRIVAGALREAAHASARDSKFLRPLDLVAARVAAPVEQALGEFLRERTPVLKRWQQRR